MQSKDDDIYFCCVDMQTSQRDRSRKELGGITNDDGDAIFETQKVLCLKKTHNKRPKTHQICGKNTSKIQRKEEKCLVPDFLTNNS